MNADTIFLCSFFTLLALVSLVAYVSEGSSCGLEKNLAFPYRMSPHYVMDNDLFTIV